MTPKTTVTGGDDVDTSAICCNAWEEAGHAGVQYWRVSLRLGDRLTIDFDNVSGSGTGVCVMSPKVTDYTVADAECLAQADSPDTNKGELKFSAGKGGGYLVAVYDNSCCGEESWAYSMTAYVRHHTTLTLSGPHSAVRHHTITLKGVLTPHRARRLVLMSRSPAHGWQAAAHPRSSAAGKYSVRYFLGHSGRHEFKAVFKGGGGLTAATSRVWKVSVSP